MIARSISSNTRLDTLVRDHRLPVSQFSLATHGGSIHWGQALSDFPRLRRRHHSRARASLRNRHTGPSIMGFEDEVEQSLGRPCRQTDGRSKQTRKLTSSIVPRGTSFHHLVETRVLLLLILTGSHAAAASLVQRNSAPSTHMRCIITANRRASATIALFIPRRLAICIAQALSQDHFAERNSMA